MGNIDDEAANKSKTSDPHASDTDLDTVPSTLASRHRNTRRQKDRNLSEFYSDDDALLADVAFRVELPGESGHGH